MQALTIWEASEKKSVRLQGEKENEQIHEISFFSNVIKGEQMSQIRWLSIEGSVSFKGKWESREMKVELKDRTLLQEIATHCNGLYIILGGMNEQMTLIFKE